LNTNKANPRAWFRAFFTALLVVCLCLNGRFVAAQADSLTHVSAVKLEPSKTSSTQGWNLSAEFDVQLGPKLREALDRGLPLQFAVEFKLMRHRWYWFDEETVTARYAYTLSYNALTRTYRLVSPAGTFNSSQFDDVLHNLERLVDWTVLRKEQVQIGASYKAQIRFHLVLTELPKPVQVSALANSDWDLSSDWLYFDFVPSREALK
jgi:hypothetical protein